MSATGKVRTLHGHPHAAGQALAGEIEKGGFVVVEEGAKKGDRVVAPVTGDVRDGVRVK